MNKCIICGRLTKDPVLSERTWTNQETGEVIKAKVCNFSVAVNEGYGERETVTYFRVAVWRGMAEACNKYLNKGSSVLISGPVKQNNYIDNAGGIRSGLEIRAEEVQFLSPRKKEEEPIEDEEDYELP